MSMLVSFVLSFFPRDVLDEILNLIGSVSEGFPSYSSKGVRAIEVLLYLSLDIINKLKFTTNCDRCAILNVLNCLTKNFES